MKKYKKEIMCPKCNHKWEEVVNDNHDHGATGCCPYCLLGKTEMVYLKCTGITEIINGEK